VRTNRTHTLVDGGVLSNFPITVFDRSDGEQPRWPTFGVKIVPQLPSHDAEMIPIAGRIHIAGVRQLERVLLAARNRGYKLLHMMCLAENQRMQELAMKFDAELTFDFGSVVGEVEAPHPTPMSVMRELVADSTGFATAMLDLHARTYSLQHPEHPAR